MSDDPDADISKFAEAFNRSQEAKDEAITRLKAELAETSRAKERAEAKCAEMHGVLIETKKLIQYPVNLQAAPYLPYLNRLDAAFKDNPGQTLLDRLHRAEARCARIAEILRSGYSDHSTRLAIRSEILADSPGQSLVGDWVRNFEEP